MNKTIVRFIAMAVTSWCLLGTTTHAVDLDDVYVTGGLAYWPEFGAPPNRFSFEFPGNSIRRNLPSESSSQTSFKFGAGYSINETWSVEAVAIVGMEHETNIPSLFDGFSELIPIFTEDERIDDFEIRFDLDITSKLKASILRTNPVYTLPIQEDFSFIGAAGIAFIERDMRTTIRSDYQFDDDIGGDIEIFFPDTAQTASDSDSSTNLFASAGIRWNPGGGQSSITVSYTNYFDTPGDITQSLELDYQWKF